MIKLIIALTAIVLGFDVSFAQVSPWPQVTQLDKSNVYFACNISNITFVYLTADFDLMPDENRRTIKSIDATAAEDAARPDDRLQSLFNFAADYEVTFEREIPKTQKIKKESIKGLPVPIWHRKWALLPTTHRMSGVPFEYHSFVRIDGKPIAPHIYFCDFTYINHRTYFSSLPFSLVKASAGKPRITGDKALALCRNAISSLPNADDLPQKLALKQILFHELPFAEKLWDKKASVYELQFQEQDNVNRLMDRKPLSLWVTMDGHCSTLSLEGWSISN